MLAEILVFGFWCYVVYLAIFYGLMLIQGVKDGARYLRARKGK